jgi:integrase
MQLNTRLIPYFDGVRRLRLAEIQPRDVKACVRWLVEQRDPRTGRLFSKSTIRQTVGVLRALLGDAMEEGLIRTNPARGIRVVVPEGAGTGRAPAAEKRAMTITELKLVLGALPAEWRLMFELLARSGLRIGEAIELRWGRDLVLDDRPRIKGRWQFADGRVCEPKTRYGKRDIPLSPGLTKKLLLAQPLGADGQLVFTTSFGTRLNRHNLYATSSAPPSAPSACRGSRPHVPAYVCVAGLRAEGARRRRQEREAGPGVARPPLRRVQAPRTGSG